MHAPRTLKYVYVVAALAFAAFGIFAFANANAQDATGTPNASPAASPNASPMASPAVGDAMEVDMVDIAFTQKELTIPANTPITITVKNNGVAVHNFTIDDLSVTSGDVQPGASTTVTLNAAPGEYQYYCSIPGHKEAGMVGKLIVK